jgi:beta-glucanase (GH16 family)
MRSSSWPARSASLVTRRRGIAGAVTLVLLLAAGHVLEPPAESAGLPRPVIRATLVVLPPIVQPGRLPVDPARGVALVASFTPARPGREVVFERAVRGGGWRVVGREPQDEGGSAALLARGGTYRASTVAGGLTWSSRRVRARRWRPAFEDTFSGDRLDSVVWNDQEREHQATYAPRTCTLVHPSTRTVGDGVLHLGLRPDASRTGQVCDYAWNTTAGQSPYLLTSQVATEHTHHFQHGIVAARIKPQRADGMHSALWMLPRETRFVAGDPGQGAEIDVMEFWGEKGRRAETIGSFITWYGPGWSTERVGAKFPDARRALGEGREWWQEFHVFSVEWTPEHYVFRVDGREYYRESQAVSQVPQYLVLSMLASDYELDDLDASDLDDTAQVDWVQVYDATSR